jgi:hypothetical protein
LTLWSFPFTPLLKLYSLADFRGGWEIISVRNAIYAFTASYSFGIFASAYAPL